MEEQRAKGRNTHRYFSTEAREIVKTVLMCSKHAGGMMTPEEIEKTNAQSSRESQRSRVTISRWRMAEPCPRGTSWQDGSRRGTAEDLADHLEDPKHANTINNARYWPADYPKVSQHHQRHRRDRRDPRFNQLQV